jgi:hypothetical protein
MAYLVEKNNKTLKIVNYYNDYKELIRRDFNHKKQDEYNVINLQNGKPENIYMLMRELRQAQPKKKPTKKKTRRNDVIDNKYSEWLGTQPCVITGRTAKRGAGANDMHCHHINGRVPRNDYQQVPLIGYVHSWGADSYHSLSQKDFARIYLDENTDVKKFFTKKANELLIKYKETQK